jgi:alpha-tubulin suppressor-like RCC1 family protein
LGEICQKEMWMLLFRLAGVVALSALLVTGGAGGAIAAPPTPSSGPTVGGTTVSGTITGVTFTQVSAGYEHSLAVGSDGKIYAWGANGYGQLGNGSNPTSDVPVLVMTPANVTFTQVSAGGFHSLAVGSDGNTYAWGDNSNGQLGNGSNTNSNVPVQVTLPTGVTFTQVSAGTYHSLAVGSDNKTYAWGENRYGKLGNGSNTDSNVPVQVTLPTAVTFIQVSAGGTHSLAVGSDNNTYAWGYNSYGQLGNGSSTNSNVPVQVTLPTGVTFTQVSAGLGHSLAVGSDGNAYAWGSNSYGQLGDNTTTDSNLPVSVPVPGGSATFTQVSAGRYHSLAVDSNGNSFGWGNNSSGQLGNTSTADSHAPLLVTVPAGVTFTQMSAGAAHSLAVGSDGKSYAWGKNDLGQLGNNTLTDSHVPVPVYGPVVVTGVSFDGVPGTGLLSQPAGTWSVVTPAHTSGAVDVLVSYTQFGVAGTEVTAGGFTFAAAPVATLAATGSPTPYPAIGTAFLLIMVGGAILATRRRHRQNKVN